MPHFLRRAFPYFALALLLAALAWAVSFGTLPKADFSFSNGDELETLELFSQNKAARDAVAHARKIKGLTTAAE